MHALQQGAYVEPTKATVADFLRTTWLPAAKGTLRPTAFSSYEMHVRCYLTPAFGHLQLQQLTPAVINAFYASLREGWNGRRSLSPASVRRVHATLHRALRDAVRWQLIARNPATGADPPKARRPEMRIRTPEQLRKFLQGTHDDRHYAQWLFYVLTGVRRGEALALRWSDTNLQAGNATILRSLVPVDHRLVIGEPKTSRGRRRISLDQRLVDELRHHRRHQSEERLLIGPPSRTRTCSSLTPMAHHYAPSRFLVGSPLSANAPECRRSGSMTSGTYMQRSPWPQGYLPELWPTGSVTPRQQ